MKRIEIYTTATCPYCLMAKNLLKQKNIDFTEIRIDQHPEKRQEMLLKSQGHKTVPQIFIDQQFIGGYDDLCELEKQQKLNMNN